jgi:hypothetical protein
MTSSGTAQRAHILVAMSKSTRQTFKGSRSPFCISPLSFPRRAAHSAAGEPQGRARHTHRHPMLGFVRALPPPTFQGHHSRTSAGSRNFSPFFNGIFFQVIFGHLWSRLVISDSHSDREISPTAHFLDRFLPAMPRRSFREGFCPPHRPPAHPVDCGNRLTDH